MPVSSPTTPPDKPRVLTIAGSDTGAGAGIQADTKTISACGAYALTAITALTAQDPDGVQAVWPVTAAQLSTQIRCALRFSPAAIKIGMLGDAALVHATADALVHAPSIPLVLDTPIRASSGASGAALLDDAGVQALKERLLPQATLVTPNRQEARALFGSEDERDWQDWVQATGVAVLITGGDSHPALAGELRFCTDVLVTPSGTEHLTSPRVETRNDHGTGCTLTAAIASFLAHGFPLPEAVHYGRHYVQRALQSAARQHWPGRGPLDHFFAFGSQAAPEN